MKQPRNPARNPDGRRRYKKMFWGGFCENALHMRYICPVSGDESPAIFTNKRIARLKYEDVRPIEIREYWGKK